MEKGKKMKIRTVLLMAGVAAGAVYLLRKSGTSQVPAAAPVPESTAQAPAAAEPVVNMVEETLRQHEGEDNPVVHAFEEAVSHTHQGD